MSKSILSKVAAIACGVASVAVLTVTATAAKTVLEVNKTNYPEIQDGKLNFVATRVTVDEADVKAATNGYVISYSVEVANNPGYASAGVAVVYDQRLTPVMNGENVKYEKGDAGSAIGVVKENISKHLVGCGASAMENVTANGKYITIDFKLPADAKAGDKYPFTWDIDSVINANDDDVDWNEVDGYIEIATPTTAPTTTTTTQTTTSTTPTTSVTTPTTSNPIVTTTSTTPASATGSTTSNTTVSNTTAKPGTTTKAANGGNNANSTKTGDAGAGVAAAALLLAAGTAVVAGKKKKD